MMSDINARMTAIECLLTALGSTTNDVANSLMANGVKGNRQSCYHCPIAVYLKKATGDVVIVESTHAGIQYKYDLVRLPVPVQQFIIDFDRGFYPELEEHRNAINK